MKTRKTFSVMLVICMLLSLVFPSSWGVSNAASASDKVTVIDVTQYGADPTGVKAVPRAYRQLSRQQKK